MRDGFELHRFSDVEAFEVEALSFLLEREAEHNLILGIVDQIKRRRHSDPYLVTVVRGRTVVATAFRTPPFQPGLSHVDDKRAIELIARDMHDVYDALPGVQGSKDDALAFARQWQELTGQSFEVRMKQRIYEATEATAPVGVPGELRAATTKERDLLVDWFRARNEEDLGAGEFGPGPETVVDFRLGGSGGPLFIWWTDRPVSMAGASGPTPNGVRVNAVFTPPELRRNGYATACVAALTQHLLDEDRRFCFLYTDLSNPTSNSIYQAIGYRPVCDVDQYRFN